MNTKVIGLIVAGLLIAGGAFYFVSSGDDDETSSANNDTSQQDDTTSNTNADTNNLLGIDTAALEGAYKLTVTSNEDGEDLEGTFLLDGNGNVSTMVTTDGQTAGLIVLDGVTYFQNPQTGEWLFYPEGNTSAPTFDLDDLAISNEDINEINNDSSIEDLGEQPCAAGTCRVWRDVDPVENETAVVKVDSSNGRLVEVSITNNTTQSVTTINYEYPDNITITAPEGAQEFVVPEFTQ